MCRILDVSRSGYYAWKDRKMSQRTKDNERLIEMIKQVFISSRKTYGSPRVFKQLQTDGVCCGRNRVARLMRREHIVAQRQRRYKRSTQTLRNRINADNILNREFHVERPNKVWASDITAFWTGSGWMHLAVVMDLYSRRIIGWSLNIQMTQELTQNALTMAIANRKITNRIIHHSDQGSQYGSDEYQQILKERNMICSMSRKGDCYDNAVVESFFKTLKAELTHERVFKSREEARSAIFEYIEIFYNRTRLHSTLGYRSPVEFETKSNLT
jgi:transposase InsO family protein